MSEDWRAKDESFAELFREAKISKNTTFREIAKHAGVSISYLCDVQARRKGAPNLDIVQKIEESLQITDGSLARAASVERHKTLLDVLKLENERLKNKIREYEEASAVCPEDVGFVEYIQSLQRAVKRLESEVYHATKAGTPYWAERDAQNALVLINNSLRSENERLKEALKALEDEAFRVADAENYPHLKRAVVLAQSVLSELSAADGEGK